MSIFVNWSNHPYDTWDPNQLTAAKELGTLEFLPFPEVTPASSAQDVEKMANNLIDSFSKKYPHPESVVTMIQGEMTLLYHLLKLLENKQYRVVAATSERIIERLPDGRELKTFKFCRFRDYFVTTTPEERS